MKKISGILVLVFVVSANCFAQPWYWGSSTTDQTYTAGNVGIGDGITSCPTTAKLQINNGIGGVIVPTIPEIKINRITSSPAAAYPNFFEIWRGASAFSGFTTWYLYDVFDSRGYLGIGQAAPAQALDVNGNGLIEKSFAISDNLVVGYPSYAGDAKVHIVNNVSLGATNVPELMITRKHTLGLTGPDILKIQSVSGFYPPTTTTLDVINNNGYFGVLQPNPSAPLDVAGNGLIEQNLTVENNSTVGHDLAVSNNAAVGVNLMVKNAAIIGVSTTSGASATLPTPGLGSTYSLYVANGILTEKLNVALSTSVNWADFVFNPEYHLMPLKKVDAYVKENKHLPDVPSANEVVADGIDVAKMDAKLLQKIEELTLYAIQQQKQTEKLEQTIAAQQLQIEELKKGLSK